LNITLETQKFRVRNPLNQELHFCIENTLKLAYKHLEVKKIFRGLRPLDPQEEEGKGKGWERRGNRREEGRGGRGQEGEGREGEGRRGKGGGKGRKGKGSEGMWPPSKNSLKKALEAGDISHFDLYNSTYSSFNLVHDKHNRMAAMSHIHKLCISSNVLLYSQSSSIAVFPDSLDR
jgi:hypothetical protein